MNFDARTSKEKIDKNFKPPENECVTPYENLKKFAFQIWKVYVLHLKLFKDLKIDIIMFLCNLIIRSFYFIFSFHL